MRDLFYSTQEKILFFVAGYRDNSTNVADIIQMLTTEATKLASLISAEIKDVKTFYVPNSRRYKYMRVFYIENVPEPKNVPELFKLSDDWTMKKWVTD